MATAAPGGARPSRRTGATRLVGGGGRRSERPGRKGGSATGPNPVDRGKTGSKIHVLTDAAGLPLACAVSGANVHDMNGLNPLVTAIPAIRSRRGPRRRRPAKLHADKGYDFPELRSWLSSRGTIPRIARRGIESSQRLGRYRWVVERTIAWLGRYRRLVRRYDRHGHPARANRPNHPRRDLVEFRRKRV